MTSNTEMSRFLEEGLARYAGAKDAVDLFEREMQERLLRRLEEKQDWMHFSPLPGGRGRGKSTESGVYRDDEGTRIWATQARSGEAGGWIELSLWWGSRLRPDGVLARVVCFEEGYRVKRGCRLDKPAAPVLWGVVNGKRPSLHVVVERAGPELDDLLRLLLGEMDRALGLDHGTEVAE